MNRFIIPTPTSPTTTSTHGERQPKRPSHHPLSTAPKRFSLPPPSAPEKMISLFSKADDPVPLNALNPKLPSIHHALLTRSLPSAQRTVHGKGGKKTSMCAQLGRVLKRKAAASAMLEHEIQQGLVQPAARVTLVQVIASIPGIWVVRGTCILLDWHKPRVTSDLVGLGDDNCENQLVAEGDGKREIAIPRCDEQSHAQKSPQHILVSLMLEAMDSKAMPQPLDELEVYQPDFVESVLRSSSFSSPSLIHVYRFRVIRPLVPS